MKRIMKTAVSLCTAAVFIFPCTALSVQHITAIAEEAFAESAGGTYENLSWSIDDGVLTISGEGEMYKNDGIISSSSYPWYGKHFHTVIIENGVKSISDYAFFHSSALTSCILPDTLIEIGKKSFGGSGLTDIILPEGLLNIGEQAFDTAEKMNDLIIPDSVLVIEDNSFTNAVSITLGANTIIKKSSASSASNLIADVTYIHDKACINNIFVSSDNPYYTAQDGILYNKDKTRILDYASAHIFENDTYVLPDTLDSVNIGNEPIMHNNIKHFAVSEENEYFSTIDGVLVSKDEKNIICYPYARDDMIYTVPNGITEIGESAFYKSKVSYVILSDTVISVGKTAFKKSKLKRFDSTPNLNYIGDYAFSYCDMLYTELSCLSGGSGDNIFDIDKMTVIRLPANSEFDLEGTMVDVIYGDETNGEVTDSGIHGNFTWEISNGTLCITGNGKMDEYEYNDYPWYGLDYYFLKFNGENIEIPDEAFYGAEKLCTAEFDGVVSVGADAFNDCRNLVNVIGGDDIEYVDDYAFFNTDWLSTPVNHYRTDDAVGLCVLGSVVLYCDESAESVCIPEWITHISRDAFNFSSSLNTLYISEKGFECLNNTFSYCSKIEHLRFIGNESDITLEELQEEGDKLEEIQLSGDSGETAEGKAIYSNDVILNIINMLENTIYIKGIADEYCCNVINEIGCHENMTDEELIFRFYEYLMDETYYGYTYIEDTNGIYKGAGTSWSENTLFTHKATGLAIMKSGVCSSYSELFKVYAEVLAKEGISTTITAMENFGAGHQWNVIGLDTGTENERWYYHDASNGQCLIGYENGILKSNPEMFAYDGDIPENEDGTYTITLKDGTLINLQGEDAERNVLTGDADGNGSVDISDAVLVLKVYAQKAADLTLDEGYTDTDGDGVTEIGDASAILTYYAMSAADIPVSWEDIFKKAE